ncbi:MAG: HEAT repeat domain-containing protein [Geobacteraceae bacterium]|nr:HEAT repeat domain-containing protein [Geobacteraceae bacterium]
MDANQRSDIQSSGIDIRALASLITELNISRRNFKSYPKGHPVIEGAFQRVISRYNKLLDVQGEVTIGVAKDALMFGTTILEKSNLVYRDFARVLFEHGIAVLTLRRGLTTNELEHFNVILGLKREEINRQGGIEALWEKGQISSLAITAIRYDLFSASGNETAEEGPQPGTDEGIWERITRALMAGNSVRQDGRADPDIDPELLASMLNNKYEHAAANNRESDDLQAVADLIRQENNRQTSQATLDMPYNKLAAFVNKLNPNLRRQFLSSTFDIKKLDGTSLTEDLVGNMSADTILETLEDLNQHQVNVPPVIMGLLQKLSAHAGNIASGNRMTHPHENDMQERMRSVFKEHASEEFTPDDYQQKLNALIAQEQMPQSVPDAIDDLLASVESNVVEERISDIIMNLVTTGGESPEEREFFLQNLSDMFGYFLQTGDYGQLVKMIDQSTDSAFPIDIQYYLRENYVRREFLDEILNGLTIWGKPRYHDIKLLITKIRSPFIEVLLDHLATEDNMSLRRFMMDRLIEMGPVTRVPIAIRLDDERWFVLRNLIVILRAHSDTAIIPLIRPLTNHSNSRVRQEALSTLVMLHDAAAEKQVLRDLDSEDRETLYAAITLSEKSRLPDIHKKLLAMLSNGGLTQLEYELKSTVVKSLGELQRSETLPEFAKILGSTSLFHNKLLTRLKLDILRALGRYPLQTVAPLLQRISAGKDEVARQAEEFLKNVKATTHER